MTTQDRALVSFLLIALSIPHFINAQISGTIVDSRTKETISHVSIGISNKTTGTISNSDGEFSLPSKYCIEGDTLLISHVNYHTKKIAITSLAKAQNTIALEPREVTLDEIIILSGPVTELLERVIRTSSQASKIPIKLKTYYRDFVKRDTSYVNFSDGQLDYYLSGEAGNVHSVLLVNDSRAFNLPAPEDEQLDMLLTSLIDVKDCVKNYEVEKNGKFLKPENYNDYNYELHSFSKNQKSYHYIEVKPKTEVQKLLLEGRIVFDPETNLILSISSFTPPSHLPYAKEASALVVKAQLTYASTDAIFTTDRNSYRLSYVRKQINLRFWNNRKIDRTFSFVSDALIFDTEESVQKYPRKSNYSKSALFKRATSYSRDYWKEEASMPLTAEEERIIANINAKQKQ